MSGAPRIRESAAPAAAPVGGVLEISVRRRQRISRVYFADPSLIRVDSGTKILEHAAGRVVANSGDFVFVNAGQTVDLLNVPGADEGVYRATCMSFDRQLVRSVAMPGPGCGAAAVIPCARLDCGQGLAEAFEHAARGLIASAGYTQRLLRHRLAEVLIAVDGQGFRVRVPPEADTAERLRRLLRTAPGASWTAPEAAQRLHLSEATLRRRLRESGSGFRQILDAVRLELALARVQGSRDPIAIIALDCGYASASKFSARFRRHYGIAPNDLRG